MKKVVLLAFVLVVLSTAVVVGFVRPAVAEETIYIRADGSVEGTTDISTVDNVTYTFTDNIFNQTIVVERDNIVVDGAGYTVQGTGGGTGINMTERGNVTIKNVEVTNFTYGILLSSSNNNTITGNTVSNNYVGVQLGEFNGGLYSSNNNNLSGNTISYNSNSGIALVHSNNNTITGNIASNNHRGIYLYHSSNSILFHNNLNNNTVQAFVISPYVNKWDFEGEGNYWSDYEERYPNATEIDGIWDTPYVIDENNQDNYPIVPEFPTWTSILLLFIVLSVAIAIYKRRLLNLLDN